MRIGSIDNRQACFAFPTSLVVLTAFGVGLFLFAARDGHAQKIDQSEINRARKMLRDVKSEFIENYYDATFHGMNIEERFRLADEKMMTAESVNQLLGIIAQVLLDLNDSHTSFVPPAPDTLVEYGWRMKAIGDDCYISEVKRGSDAEAKGLTVGDKVLTIDKRPMDRTKIWLARYLYYRLRPQPAMTLLVQKLDGQLKELFIQAQKRDLKDRQKEQDLLNRNAFYELSEDILVWKMPNFDLTEDEVDDKANKFRRRKALILDLRGNPGGYSRTLERFAGHFFSNDVKIAERKGRKEMKPMLAKGRKERAFTGKLVVLIDAESSSASEVFARVMQLEKRGTVIGDRSAGKVMESRLYPLQLGAGAGLVLFGVRITKADLIMADNQSLEHVGVTPDEFVLPTPEDLAAHRDPVLAHAASVVGVKMDPVKAGGIFPTE